MWGTRSPETRSFLAGPVFVPVCPSLAASILILAVHLPRTANGAVTYNRWPAALSRPGRGLARAYS